MSKFFNMSRLCINHEQGLVWTVSPNLSGQYRVVKLVPELENIELRIYHVAIAIECAPAPRREYDTESH